MGRSRQVLEGIVLWFFGSFAYCRVQVLWGVPKFPVASGSIAAASNGPAPLGQHPKEV